MKTKLIAWIALVLLAGSVLTACHTAEGFGKDLEEAGEAIQEEAR